MFTTRPEILGTFGVVTSTHWLATATGMAMLERGGNAFDAGVTTGFALQVVEPHLNGPGGEVPIMVAPANTGDVKVICGQGVAPAAANIEVMKSFGCNIMPGSGLLTAVVPGAFDAWMLLLRDYGTMRLRDVLEPAINFARNGYPLVPNVAFTIEAVQDLFRDEWTTSADVYLPGGNVPKAGTIFRNVAMAAMYERLLKLVEQNGGNREAEIEYARHVWYKGFVAEAIDEFCASTYAMDTTGERHKGLLTGEDMATWSATYEAPLTYDYEGYTVCKTGPWGQGPVFLQALAILKGMDFTGLSETSPEFIHMVTEATKLAYADRDAFYGDPDFVEVPMEVLLSDTYNAQRRQLITDQALGENVPGNIPGYGCELPERLKGQTPEGINNTDMGEPTVARFKDKTLNPDGLVAGDTTHFDIIDRHGNMVTATPSGGWLQSSPIVPELGFCLSNRGQVFWLDEKIPSHLQPRKRPRTTLSVGMALREGVPYMAFGTPGGDSQDQWSLHFFLRHVHFGLNLQEAIDAPGFNTAHGLSSFYPREEDLNNLVVENRLPQSTIESLRAYGHNLIVDEGWCLGRMTAASKENNLLKAAANPRFMQGYAIGR